MRSYQGLTWVLQMFDTKLIIFRCVKYVLYTYRLVNNMDILCVGGLAWVCLAMDCYEHTKCVAAQYSLLCELQQRKLVCNVRRVN